MFELVAAIQICIQNWKTFPMIFTRKRNKIKHRIEHSHPGGYFQIRRSGGGGGLDLTSSLKAKFGARSGQVHKIRGKIWEVLSPKDTKVGKKSQFWGHI